MEFDINNLQWTRQPKSCVISREQIEIVTQPHTDLWQRTYYHFRNDNAPVLQMDTEEKFFPLSSKQNFLKATIVLTSAAWWYIWILKTG